MKSLLSKADEIKFLVMIYWRFTQQHYLVAPEYDYGDADVISVSEKGKVVCETEVKISIQDLKAERRKPKHFKDSFGKRIFNGRYVDFFYFAMPSRLAELDRVQLICDQLYPYAGILAVKPYEHYLSSPNHIYENPPVECVKRPTNVKKYVIPDDEIMRITRRMSNSFCNLSFRLMRTERSQNEE